MMSISDMQNIIKSFCEERDWDQFHNPKDLAIGISTEASELLDLFRFKSEEQIDFMFKDRLNRTRIDDELADIFFFVLRFAQKNDINLEEALMLKLDKNATKYPVEKVKGKNLKYNEY